MSLHNIIGSEAYIHEDGRDVWAGMLRFVSSRRSRVRKLIRWSAAVGIGAFVGLSALGLNADFVTSCAVGVMAGGAVLISDGWRAR